MMMFISQLDQLKLIDATLETFNLLLVSTLISLPIGSLLGMMFALYEKKVFHKFKSIVSVLSILVSVIRSSMLILILKFQHLFSLFYNLSTPNFKRQITF